MGPPRKIVLDTTSGIVTGLNVALANGTALVSGVLTNNLGQEIGGIEVKISDPSRTAFQTGATTDSLGRYGSSATSGNLSFDFDNSRGLAAVGLLASPANPMSRFVPGNEAWQVNFLAIQPTAHIRGRVGLWVAAGQ